MGIRLKGAIVILDEAHNAEDMGRGAASREIDLSEINNTMRELQRLIATGAEVEAHQALLNMIDGLSRWMESEIEHIQPSAAHDAVNMWTGEQAVTILDSVALRPDTIPVLKKHVRFISSPTCS